MTMLQHYQLQTDSIHSADVNRNYGCDSRHHAVQLYLPGGTVCIISYHITGVRPPQWNPNRLSGLCRAKPFEQHTQDTHTNHATSTRRNSLLHLALFAVIVTTVKIRLLKDFRDLNCFSRMKITRTETHSSA